MEEEILTSSYNNSFLISGVYQLSRNFAEK